ncbi:hypothetical protein [Streptomyces nigrescens]
MTTPPPGYQGPQAPDWSTPEKVAEFVSDCGESCTFTPTEWVGSRPRARRRSWGRSATNCTTENVDFNYGESETTGEPTIVGLSLGATPGALLPEIEHNWFKSNTESTVTTW